MNVSFFTGGSSRPWRARWRRFLAHRRMLAPTRPIGGVHRNEEPLGQLRRLCRIRRECLRNGNGWLFRRSALPRPPALWPSRGSLLVLAAFERARKLHEIEA